MSYKGKLLTIDRPWWRHPMFPWGRYALKRDKFDHSQTLVVDGFESKGDGGGGLFHWSPDRTDHKNNS